MALDPCPETSVICDGDARDERIAQPSDARVAQAPAQAGDGARDATSSQEAVLERLLEAIPDDSDAHEALARIYAEGGRWAELAELHAKRFDVVRDPGERAALLRKIAAILRERFDDDHRAFEVLLDALREDFGGDETARELEAVARWSDRFGELLVACNDWLRDPNIGGSARVALLLRVGVWYGDDLGKPAWGMPYLEEARALCPNDVRVLRAIVRVQTAAGALSRCEPVLRRILEIDPSDREAADLLERIVLGRGAIYDLVAFLEQRVRDSGSVALNPLRAKLAVLHATLPGGAERACALLAEAHALDPNDLEVLRAYDARLVASQRWSELGAVLEERIERAGSEGERVALLLRLAQLHEEHDLDPDRAAQRLEQVVEVDPRNDDAWRGLERCYSKLRLWDAAVFAYERHVEAVEDVEARIAAFTGMARVLSEELDVPDRALEAYGSALDLDPERVSLLEAMAKLHERNGDLPRALSAMEQVVERASAPGKRVEALCRLAATYRSRAADTVKSRALFREALDLDPTNTVALSALRKLAIESDDAAEAARLLDREQRHTASPRVRAKLLVELALLRRDRLDDVRGAKHAFEEAHAADPENDDAALAIAEGHVERSEWSVAEPLLQRLGKSAGRRPVYEQITIFAQLGLTHLARGEDTRALDAFRRAQSLGPVDLDVVRGLAEAAFRVGAMEEALVAQQKVVTGTDEQRAESLHRLGEIYRALGDERRARVQFERAAHDGAFRPSLRALIELGAADNDWDDVAALEERLLADCEREEKLALLRDSARRWSERAGDHARAASALDAALQLQPDDRRLLLELLRAREALGDKPGIVSAIERLLVMEHDPAVRARYRLTVAAIAEELGDTARAAAEYDASLDDDPRAIQVFRAVERLLEAEPAARELSLRKMIHRARTIGDDALEFELWHKLGVLYRDALSDAASSLEAFRMASRLRPDDSHERHIIASLCVATDREDLAIRELGHAIAREPMDVTHHQALYRLYVRTGELDRAYAVASALVFLKGADAEQRACFAEFRPRGVPEFRARLGRASWIRDLAHPELDRGIGSVFEVIARGARVARFRALNSREKVPSLEDAKREDAESTKRLAVKAFFGAAAVLGLEPPQLWVRADLPGAVAAVPVEPIVSLLGSTLLSGWSVPELMFVFAKHLTVQHGEHAVRAHFPSISELSTLFAAAVKVAQPSFSPSARAADAVHRAHQALLRELRPDEQERLGHVVGSLRELGVSSDVTRWMQCSELTALRAGLLVCGDLSVAAKIVRQEPVVAGDLSPTEKVRELVRFTVSDAYHQLRRSLGIDVRARARGPGDDDDEPTLERALCA